MTQVHIFLYRCTTLNLNINSGTLDANSNFNWNENASIVVRNKRAKDVLYKDWIRITVMVYKPNIHTRDPSNIKNGSIYRKIAIIWKYILQTHTKNVLLHSGQQFQKNCAKNETYTNLILEVVKHYFHIFFHRLS